MNAIAHTHVTPLKTPLNDTQIPLAMETIRTILEHILYIGITLPLILILLATIIPDTRQLRDWLNEPVCQEGEGSQDPQQDPQNPVKGDHI